MNRVTLFAALSLFLVTPSGIFANEIVFNKTKEVVHKGDKSKEIEVALVFQEDKIVIKHRKENDIYWEIPYTTITDLTYERSTHPRTMEAILVSPLFLFSSGKKHWLTIQYNNTDGKVYVLLKLDKKEYQQIIAEAETRTSLNVKRIIED
jgi:hypothetical protein